MEDLDMETFHEYIDEYRKQLGKGYIREAYKGLMGYITDLKLHFKNKYPDFFVSGSVQYGYMDYTYFYFFPKSLKKRNLKIVILFIHDTFTFEAWLAGYNKNVQTKYWKLFKESNWKKYNVAPTAKGVDYILNCTLVKNADFGDLDKLTKKIEKETLSFIKDIEDFLLQTKVR
jgi:hypothetical protein